MTPGPFIEHSPRDQKMQALKLPIPEIKTASRKCSESQAKSDSRIESTKKMNE